MRALLVACVLSWPVSGPVTAVFAPVGSYAGHWGVDVAADVGTVVQAPAAGVVAFAGSVAGMRTVSLDVDGGIRVSLSYLAEVTVARGARIVGGEPVGRVGLAHGRPAVHVSVRVDGEYRDPLPYLSCRFDLAAGLWLIEPRIGAP